MAGCIIAMLTDMPVCPRDWRVNTLLPQRGGVKLGINGVRLAAANRAEAVAYAATIEEHVRAARASGAKTLTAIAAYLNNHAIPSREGKLWHPSSVSRAVKRLNEADS